MIRIEQGPRINTLDDEERAARIAEYEVLLAIREPLAGPKRDEVLQTAIDALTHLKEW